MDHTNGPNSRLIVGQVSIPAQFFLILLECRT